MYEMNLDDKINKILQACPKSLQEQLVQSICRKSFTLTVGGERMLLDAGKTFGCAQDNQIPEFEATDAPLYFEQFEDAWIIAFDTAGRYPEIVRKAIRIWVFVMPCMLFMADYVVSKEPIGLETEFVMNNEGNLLDVNVYNNRRLVFRRNKAAMKLFNFGNWVDGIETEPRLSFNRSYAPLYDKRMESAYQEEGSTLIYCWDNQEEQGRTLQRVHVFMMDKEVNIKQWHARETDDFMRIEAPDQEDVLDFRFQKEGFEIRRKGKKGYWTL